MKTFTFLTRVVCLASALFVRDIRSEIIGVETFDYADSAIAGQRSGTFWNYNNTNPSDRSGVASTWDNISGAPVVRSGKLVTDSNSAKREYANTESAGAINNTSAAQVVYYRCTVTIGAVIPDFFGLSSYEFGTERVFFGKPTGSATFGLSTGNGSDTLSNVAVQPNTTYTLVTRLDFAANTISLYINPDLNGAEPATATVNTTYTGTASTAVRLASGGSAAWDNLVVATTWEDLGTEVNTPIDEDNGSLDPAAGGGAGVSLREAAKYSPSGTLVTFDPTKMDGGTILFTLGEIQVNTNLTLDASSLPHGLTLDADQRSRHFLIAGPSVTLTGLTLVNGNGVGANSSLGGSILNFGYLSLNRCSLLNNSAATGGAIYSFYASSILSYCTLFGNYSTTTYSTGGIFSYDGFLSLSHCTISGNSGNGFGGGVRWEGQRFSRVSVDRCIIAGNIDPISTQPDLNLNNSFNILTANGPSLIGVNTSVESVFPAGPLVGTASAPLNPRLSLPGYFGGPTKTLHPLIGSRAIDAGGATDPGSTDQRGFPSFVDGDGSGTAQQDLGAVEAGPLLTVAVGSDAGSSASLRSRISQVGTTPGTRIGFSPASFPAQSIVLALGELAIPSTANGLFLDGSNLTGPVTISGNNVSRVFNIASGATVAMNNLVITGGGNSDGGGGILNLGRLSLHFSSVTSNRTADGASNSSGAFGGGIFTAGLMDIAFCTIANNRTGNGRNGNNAGSGGHGGGIFSTAQLDISSSTIANNLTGNGGSPVGPPRPPVEGGYGGGIFSFGTLKIVHSTIAANRTGNSGSSNGSSGEGGGISSTSPTPLVLQDSIVAQNFGFYATDVQGKVAYKGTNFLGSSAGSTSTTGPAPLSDDPLLAPLGDYGGPTQTVALKPGSPARNAATGSSYLMDQRRFPIVGVPDLGAYEAGTLTNYNAYIWETLPATASEAQHAADFDFDGDGATNQSEYSAGTGAANAQSLFRISAITRNTATSLSVLFPTVAGRTYALEASSDLTTWSGYPASNNIAGDGNEKSFLLTIDAGAPNAFLRVRIAP